MVPEDVETQALSHVQQPGGDVHREGGAGDVEEGRLELSVCLPYVEVGEDSPIRASQSYCVECSA